MIYTIENFITDDECKHLIDISKKQLKQALVSGDKEGFISKGRSGSNCWILHDFDAITKRISTKISKLLDMPLENSEAFQIIYYGVDQEYRQHYDGWLFDGSEKSRRNMKLGGQRIWTALGYLNNVPKGGGTKFTKLNKEVNAEKGKLLVFSNVHENTNQRHELSEHAGMPVLEGEKWAFNLWFREKSRKIEYKYPEAINPTEGINPTKKHIPDLCTIDVTDSNVTFSINYDKLYNQDNKYVKSGTDSKNVNKYADFLSDEERKSILKLCNFEDKDRSAVWVLNNKIPDIISKLSKTIDIDSSYFENMCVTKYKKGIIHRDHLDAYDLTSEKGKDYTKITGQRLITLTGFLSLNENENEILVKFPKLDEKYECKTGSIISYKNCFDNTNQRDEKFLKSYNPVKIADIGDNLEDIDNNESFEMVIFNIYIREKSRINDKVLRLDGLLKIYKSKEDISKESPYQHDKESENKDDSGFKGCPLKVIDDIYNKPLQENLRRPDFKIINKAPIPYIEETLQKIKELRDKSGFLLSENIDKEYFIDEYNPVTVENVINPEIHALIDNYFKENIKNGVYPLGDRQANRYKVTDEIMTRLLHLEFLPLIEKITGKKMESTYTYLSAYLKGTTLPPHTDRPDCEFTCSYIIGKPPNSTWNIYVHKTKQPVKYKGRYDFTPPKEECLAIDCPENGLMIFNGTDHIHFREELEHDYYNVVLLHYRGTPPNPQD